MEMEAVFDEKHGWTRYNPETQPTAEKVEVPAPVNALEVKRRGRKPNQH